MLFSKDHLGAGAESNAAADNPHHLAIAGEVSGKRTLDATGGTAMSEDSLLSSDIPENWQI